MGKINAIAIKKTSRKNCDFLISVKSFLFDRLYKKPPIIPKHQVGHGFPKKLQCRHTRYLPSIITMNHKSQYMKKNIQFFLISINEANPIEMRSKPKLNQISFLVQEEYLFAAMESNFSLNYLILNTK